jgi:hypothetical protein
VDPAVPPIFDCCQDTAPETSLLPSSSASFSRLFRHEFISWDSRIRTSPSPPKTKRRRHRNPSPESLLEPWPRNAFLNHPAACVDLLGCLPDSDSIIPSLQQSQLISGHADLPCEWRHPWITPAHGRHQVHSARRGVKHNRRRVAGRCRSSVLPSLLGSVLLASLLDGAIGN